jgi:hemoglobin/transferrin/lactoferrin receptor protein
MPMPARLRLHSLVSSALAGLALAAGLPAAAQAQAATPLDAVTTTATRTPNPAGDTAVPVSVIRREDIERRQPRTLPQLLDDIPGVEVSGVPRQSALQPTIRGLGDERIVLRLDGARLNFASGHRGRSFLDPSLLKQVDVMRGPGSVLYGSGALGGVIAAETVDADDILRPGRSFGGFVRGAAQTQGVGWAGTTAIAGRIERTSGLVALSGLTNNNFRDGRDRTIPYTAEDAWQGLAKFGTGIGGHSFQLSATRFDSRTQLPIAANTTSLTSIANRRTVQSLGTLRYAWEDASQPLVAPKVTIYGGETSISERRLTGSRALDRTELTTLGFDVQNTARFRAAGTHVLTFGFDGFRDDQSGSSNGRPRPQFPDARQTIIGVFIQDEWRPIPRLSIVPGLRYDDFDQKAERNINDRSSNRVSPKISVAYRVFDWLEPYAAYAEAFRAPSLTELYVSGQHFPGNFFVPNPDLRPEVIRNKEFGANIRFSDVLRAGDRMRARLTAFRADFDDYIESRVLSTTTTRTNVPSARIEGVEAELQYDAGIIFANLGASALRGENTDTNEPLFDIPAHRVTLTAGYRFLESGVQVGARILAAAEQNRRPAGVPDAPGYAVLDLFASWIPPFADAVRLDLVIDNVFDTNYVRANWYSGPSTPFGELGRNVRGAVRVSF